MTSPSNSKPRNSTQENSIGESGFPKALIENIFASPMSMQLPLAKDFKFTTRIESSHVGSLFLKFNPKFSTFHSNKRIWCPDLN